MALNSDQSVRRLKGEERPINNINARVKMLEALSFVDFIIIFDEETPLNVIKEIQPDILVKGASWSNDIN